MQNGGTVVTILPQAKCSYLFQDNPIYFTGMPEVLEDQIILKVTNWAFVPFVFVDPSPFFSR